MNNKRIGLQQLRLLGGHCSRHLLGQRHHGRCSDDAAVNPLWPLLGN